MYACGTGNCQRRMHQNQGKCASHSSRELFHPSVLDELECAKERTLSIFSHPICIFPCKKTACYFMSHLCDLCLDLHCAVRVLIISTWKERQTTSEMSELVFQMSKQKMLQSVCILKSVLGVGEGISRRHCSFFDQYLTQGPRMSLLLRLLSTMPFQFSIYKQWQQAISL